MNAQKERLKRDFGGSRKLLQDHKKVCDENERNKEKNHAHVAKCACKSVIDGRKHFIGCLHKTGEDDWDKLRDDSGHNEGTICLVNR